MRKNNIDLGQFIVWERGQNYPFSACMAKLTACLGGDASFFNYDFFAGVSGDDFVFAYGNNGRLNDCVSVCEETVSFIGRVFRRIGLDYEILSTGADDGMLLDKIQAFIDRGIPILVKEDAGTYNHANYDLVSAYEGDILTKECGDPAYRYSHRLGDTAASYIFVDTLPRMEDVAQVYRESMLQLPGLMTAENPTGVSFGAAGYRRWADDIEHGRYDHLTEESFDVWRDWQIYICNLATNARHGWDFLAKAYLHNPDMPNILRMIALLDRNERDCWQPLEAIGFGFGIQLKNFENREKKAEAAGRIRRLADWNDEIIGLF